MLVFATLFPSVRLQKNLARSGGEPNPSRSSGDGAYVLDEGKPVLKFLHELVVRTIQGS